MPYGSLEEWGERYLCGHHAFSFRGKDAPICEIKREERESLRPSYILFGWGKMHLYATSIVWIKKRKMQTFQRIIKIIRSSSFGHLFLVLFRVLNDQSTNAPYFKRSSGMINHGSKIKSHD